MEDLRNALKSRENRSNEIINMDHLDFSDNIFQAESGNYLKQKTYEIALVSTKGVLALGKIFKEVFEELGNQNSGTYEKWVELSGFNKRTALRYRKKFELFNLVDNSKKQEIALYSFELIEKIFQEEIPEIIGLINGGITKKELSDLLIQNKKIEEKKTKISEFKFDEYRDVFHNFSNFESKIKKLDLEKQNELKKYLEKIKEILK